jgi:hypothetical protein
MMNEEIYPQSVDFEYTIRCSAHNFKPYVYCELCSIRSQMHKLEEKIMFRANHAISQAFIALNDNYKDLQIHKKIIEELQIEVNLLKDK